VNDDSSHILNAVSNHQLDATSRKHLGYHAGWSDCPRIDFQGVAIDDLFTEPSPAAGICLRSDNNRYRAFLRTRGAGRKDIRHDRV
jgi:hypothetical protein